MTKYILHGGFTREENESNKKFFQEFLKDTPDGGTVLLVYFASRTKEMSEDSFQYHKRLLERLSAGRGLIIERATTENFIDQFKKSDAIFFNGGSTNKLLEVLKDFPDLKPLVANKTLAGSSAGSYMLATLGAYGDLEIIRSGLGFVPLRVVCHYESSKLAPNAISVEALKNTREDLELVLLKDYEWRVFKY